MHLICPQCLNAITLTDARAAGDVTCPACGSAFPAAPAGSTGAFNGAAGRTVGRFEVLAEIGSGGFGTVFKARDPELDRVVALKIPRAGRAPSGEHLERFLREARSAARLRHPAIVPIHEVGQHDGAPYLVSEFVQGTTLADLLSARRPGFRDGAELIARLADALQYAHERGVVHRDVKPSNVLLAEDGTAFLTDFGLAKRDAAEATMTVEGQVLGTPAYMPPEQARGEGHRADGRADVYSLGVMMYQLLTGELPFRGNTRMLLHQVLHDEPRPPRKLNDQIPRDLETVCLKAMAKEPARRYPKAGELAEDLRRFLRGEPVRARPVGRLERATRWARRNPALALAVTAAVLFLVVGAAVAGWFAVEANHQADDARRANGGLDRKNSELAAKNIELDRSNTELSRSQDRLEGVLARGWLLALPRQQSDPVTEQEISALEQVAEHRGEPLARRFVREALTDPALSPRLGARAEYVWQAALGLDRKRRTEAERLLLAELRSETREARRQDLALAAAALGDLSPETATAATEALALAMSKTNNSTVLWQNQKSEQQLLSEGILAVFSRMEPKEAAAMLTESINKTTDPKRLGQLALGLSAVASRLGPKEASAMCGPAARLAEAMTKTADPVVLGRLAQCLSAVIARLEPKEAAAIRRLAVARLAEAMTKTTDRNAFWQLTYLLPEVVARLEPKEASAVCGPAAASLAEAMTKTTEPYTLGYLGEDLSMVIARLEPKEAAAVCGPAAARLAEAMTKTADTTALRHLARGLSAVSARLEPKEASAVCGPAAASLAEAMTKTANPYTLGNLGEDLSAVAARLEPKEAAAVCGPAAASLAEAMSKTTDPIPLSLGHSSNLGLLADDLSAVASRLEPKEAAAVCGPAAARLAEAITNNDVRMSPELARALSAVASRLGPKEAAAVCGPAAARLTEAMKNHPFELSYLRESISAVVARLEPKEAVAILIGAFKTNNSATLDGLSAVVARLGPKEAAAVCGPAAASLAEALTKTTDPDTEHQLALGLSAVVARLEPKEAAAVCGPAAASLAEAVTKANVNWSSLLANDLSAVASRLERKEAAAVCGPAAASLAEAMTKTADPVVLGQLAQCLSAVAARLEPKEAAAVCGPAAASLAEAIKADVRESFLLADDLSAVASRLEPKEAAAVCGPAAASLAEAMTKTTNPNTLVALTQGLSALAARLEPKEAAAVCGPAAAMLFKNKAIDPFAVRWGLSMVLCGMDPGLQGKAYVAGAVAQLSGPVLLLTAPALLEPPLSPLPAQTLVDLLKEPQCVDEARRLVLDQLSRRYGRPFADQWEFARFAEEQNLGLDLTGPPRPAP